MRPASCVLALLALLACDKPRVEWNDPSEIAATAGGDRLVIDSAGQPRLIVDTARVVASPSAVGLCVVSLRTALGTSHLHAAWWSVRPDSSAVLYAAESPDTGKTWGKAAAVDTSDVSSRGCNRPPPSLTTVGDDVHVAYSMTASEGTGVFFAHFMGSMLHSPVPVIYGERLVPTAIAAEGDRVAVAYEEPNGSRRQVDVALSMTQGHIFEWHATASRDVDIASSPLVALRGPTLAVSWTTIGAADTIVSRVVRIGRIR